MTGDPLFKVKCAIDGDLFSGPCNAKGEPLNIVTPMIDSSVWDARDALQKSEGIEPRVLEISIRCALICAAWDGKPVLRASDLEPAWELARYQTRVRALLRPNEGRNFEAIAAIKILNWLKANRDGEKWFPQNTVTRATHVKEYGPSIVQRAISGLVFCGDIEEAQVKPKSGGPTKRLIRLPVESEP
jgi:hypothetical protein